MVWLDLLFDTINMSITIPKAKFCEAGKTGFFVAQCFPPGRLFINCMLETRRACLAVGAVPLSVGFQMDIHWFCTYLKIHYWHVHHACRLQHTHPPLCGHMWNGSRYHVWRPGLPHQVSTPPCCRPTPHLPPQGGQCCGST